MKLRIEPKAIRIRLTEEEINLFHIENRLSEKIELGTDNHFTYILIAGNYSDIHAQFLSSSLEIQIPFSVLRNWMNSDETGISTRKGGQIDSDKPVIIIEKDLPPRNRKQG